MEQGAGALSQAGSEWQIAATGALNATVLVLFVVCVVAAVLWTWRSLDPAVSRRRRMVITGLRALALAACFGLLIQPTLRLQRFVRTPAHLAVMIDVSGSMNKGADLSRLASVRRLLSRAESELRSLDQGFRISWYRFAEELVEAGGSSQAVAAAEEVLRTDIRGAFKSLGDHHKNKGLAGVVLISDGADTEMERGRDRSEQLSVFSELQVPVNTVLVSDGAGRKDLAISEVKVDQFAFSRAETPIAVSLRSEGIGDQKVEVILWQDGSVVQRQNLQLVEGKGQATFTVTPLRLGPHVMTVTVPVPPEDEVPENNRAHLSFKVIRDKFRILHLAGHPSWDQRFLRSTLTSWPLVDLVSFYILRTAYQSSTFGSSGMALIPFPKPQTIFERHLDEFDIVIFQDFKPVSVWADQHLKRVVDFVERGGSVVVIGGNKGLKKGGMAIGALNEVLPLRLLSRKTPDRRLLTTNPFRINLTEVGARHPITRLMTDLSGNKKLWRSLTPLDGANRVAGLAKGAHSLVEHPTVQTEDGSLPVIAVKETGKGRALMITSDSLWRWRFSGPMGGGPNDVYANFWHRAVSWLTHDPELDRLRVQVTPSPVRAGQPAQIEIELVDEAYLPSPGAQLSCMVSWIGKDGIKAQDNFTVRLNDEGRYSRQWTPKVDGPHRLTVTSGVALSTNARFLVEDKNKEMSHFDSNEPLLEEIAEATYGAHQRNALVLDELKTSTAAGKQVLSRVDIPLWDHPVAVVIILLFLSLEWLARRRMGLW